MVVGTPPVTGSTSTTGSSSLPRLPEVGNSASTGGAASSTSGASVPTVSGAPHPASTVCDLNLEGVCPDVFMVLNVRVFVMGEVLVDLHVV